jgi:hypothetical protein
VVVVESADGADRVLGFLLGVSTGRIGEVVRADEHANGQRSSAVGAVAFVDEARALGCLDEGASYPGREHARACDYARGAVATTVCTCPVSGEPCAAHRAVPVTSMGR